MRLIILPLLFLCSLSFAQKSTMTKVTCELDFVYFKKDLSVTVKNQIDSIWDITEPNTEIEFICLSKAEEKKLTPKMHIRLSHMRCDSVLTYLHRKRIRPEYTSIRSVKAKPNRNTVHSGANASYKSFASHTGITSIMVEKPIHWRRYFEQSEELVQDGSCSESKIISSVESTIYGGQGTVVVFPANCFRGIKNDTRVEVVVTLCEYYTLEDILMAGLITKNADQIIETGGMIYLECKWNGKKLELKSDAFISIYFPLQDDTEMKKGMKSFTGKNKEGVLDWEINKDGSVKEIASGDVILESEFVEDTEFEEGYGEEGVYAETDGYLMKTNKLDWINCDRFPNVGVKMDLLVKCDRDVKISFRMVFPDIKAVMGGYEYAPDGTVKFENIPKGQKAIVVAIGITKDKKYFLGTQDVVIGKAHRIEMDISELSQTKMKSELSGLF